MIPHAHAIVELLTMASLTGLLFASGLRLTPAELLASLADRARIARVLAANFVVVLPAVLEWDDRRRQRAAGRAQASVPTPGGESASR